MVTRRFFTLIAACAALSAPCTLSAADDIPAALDDSTEVTVDIPPSVPAAETNGPLAVPPAVLLGGVNASDEKPLPARNDIPAAATDELLMQALAYVYEHHPQLLAEREKLKALDESVALAISDFRPTAVAEYDKGRERKSTAGTTWAYGDTESRGLVVTQPIFSGLDSVAALKSANQRVKAGRADLIALEQQVFYNVVVAYTGLVEARSVLQLNQNNVDVLTQQRDATQVRFDVGELTRTDVSQAEARLANAKASEQQALGDVSIANANFMRAVGYSAPENAAMPTVPHDLPQTLDEALKEARDASPVIAAAKHREKAFASDVNIRVGGILPDVNLQGVMSRNEGGFSNKYNSDTLTLNVTVPLYQGGAEWARLREARNLEAQAKYASLDTLLAVEQDTNSAWQNYVTAESVIVSTEAAAKASELALEGVRNEQEFGVRTVLDVLDAEQEYMNTKVNLVRATRTHKIQAYRLLASVGKLTARELALPIQHYDPTQNYDTVKYQLLGW
jgi:TolC family type I secretion outer membrane protein